MWYAIIKWVITEEKVYYDIPEKLLYENKENLQMFAIVKLDGM